MDERRKDLSNLKTYIENTDKEITMILRNFFWDQKHIVEKPPLTECRYIAHHKLPEQSKSEHEENCYLTRHGYTLDEPLLPDPVDDNATTLVKHSKQEIREIIHAEARLDPSFKTSKPSQGPEPLSVARLQQTYTADERRAIHDAVVSAAPFCHDLADLALGSNTNMDGKKTKTRLEVLAELRNMRRRRVKYRVPSKTSNYSNVLKDVIKTQMDLYAESNGMFIKTEYGPKTFVSLNDKDSVSCKNKTSETFFIKQERVSPEAEVNDTRSDRERQHNRERQERDRDRSNRENRYDVNRRQANRSRSRDRDRNTRRYRDERDDRSTGYRRNERDVRSDRPHAYRNENNDNEKSYNSRYESRDKCDSRNRYGGTPKHENRYIHESRIKIENAYTDETEPVEIKQEIMDEDEAQREKTGTYDNKVTDSQEDEGRHSDREAYRLRNEYRNRREKDSYNRENREEGRRKRNGDEDINIDKQRDRNEDRHGSDRDERKHRNRGEDGNRNNNRNKYNDTHRAISEDSNENKRRREDKDGNRCGFENRHRDENSHRHENRDGSRHQCETEDRHENKGKYHRDKSQDSSSRHEHKDRLDSNRRKDKRRHEDRHRHGGRHAMDKQTYVEASFDANVMSRVKLEKEDLS